MRTTFRYLWLVLTLAFCVPAYAGIDIRGGVTLAQIDDAGNLRFRIENAAANPYCNNTGWGGLNYFIPKDAPQFSYWYGIVMMSLTKNKDIYVPNVSIFNATSPCDVSKTGYGLMLIQ